MYWPLAARRALPVPFNCFEAIMSGIWPCAARDGRTKSIVAAFAVCSEIVRSSARLAGTRTVIHAPAVHVGRQRPHVLDALCADGQKVVRQDDEISQLPRFNRATVALFSYHTGEVDGDHSKEFRPRWHALLRAVAFPGDGEIGRAHV